MTTSDSYDFPCVAYDFGLSEEISFSAYSELESHIKSQLTSKDLNEIKDGLSNVLYWGYATSAGRQTHRVNKFRSEVQLDQVKKFSELVIKADYNPIGIKKCKLPQFSNLSFITKILMFLDPRNFVVLDLQLAKLKKEFPESIFKDLVVYKTSLPVSKVNASFYKNWCQFCRDLALEGTTIGRRAVDVEREIFQLVKNNKIKELNAIFA